MTVTGEVRSHKRHTGIIRKRKVVSSMPKKMKLLMLSLIASRQLMKNFHCIQSS